MIGQPPIYVQHIFDELQPMIQQSQFPNITMFMEPQLPFLVCHDPVEEEHKFSHSPLHHLSLADGSVTQLKKMHKKSVTQSPKLKRVKTSEASNPNQKFGHWAIEENKRYHWFLEIHNHHFLNRHMRRMDKIFKSMAIFVGTREAEQCRSHHQKMQKKYNSICRIILNLRRQHYGSQNQELLLEDLENNGIAIADPILSLHFLMEGAQNLETAFLMEIERREDGNLEDLEHEEVKQQQKKQDPEDGPQLMQLNSEQGFDIVDELFGQVPPHFNFEMI